MRKSRCFIIAENMPSYKNKLKFLFVALLFLLTSCAVTKSVWDRQYDETFRKFLIKPDGGIVFLGNKYHYVITDKSDAIKELLVSPSRGFLFINVEKTYLKVNLKNEMSGYITIEAFFSKLPPQNYEFLRSLGFRRDEESMALTMKLSFAGNRYLPRDDPGRFFPILDRTYIIPVHYSSGVVGTTGKVVLTPFAVIADSVILLKNIVLLPFRGN